MNADLKREIARAVLTRQAARAGVDRAQFARAQTPKKKPISERFARLRK